MTMTYYSQKQGLNSAFFIVLLSVLALNVSAQTVSVKNNLLYDATLTPNLGLEVASDSINSWQLFYGLHPWVFSDNKKLCHWSIMPEWRHWFKNSSQFRVHSSQLTGWFWGIHLVGGEYNIGGKKLPFGLFKPLRSNRYEGWYAGGGLTLGRAWRLSDHWRLEAALGIGYVHTRYHRYGAEECGEDYGPGHYNYVGPTKLALNLCYDLGCKKSQPIPLPPPTVEKEPYQPHFKLAYLTPQAEQEKVRQLSGRAFLDFVVNKTDIRPDYRNNAAELAKVLQTIDVVRRDTFTTITHISIHGYASPEGSYQNNTRLAEGRAQAFAAYVRGLIALPKGIFTVESTPEDWEGLLENLGEPRTDLGVPRINLGRNQEAVLAIATSDIAPDEKERQLKRQYPQEWKQLLNEVFPALRHSDYEVSYTVRPFTVAEAARVIREKPQHLSLNEMFLVANTYEPGSQDYNDVFETAVRMYPNDETANLNAAIIALEKKDLATAKRFLQKAGSSPQAQNARAIIAIHERDFHEATELLREADLPEARHNLKELRLFLLAED